MSDLKKMKWVAGVVWYGYSEEVQLRVFKGIHGSQATAIMVTGG